VVKGRSKRRECD